MAPRDKPLPHRAFELAEIKQMIKEEIERFLSVDHDMQALLGEWDKTKKAIKLQSINIWENHVRKRGKTLKKIEDSRDRTEKILNSLPTNHASRPYVRELLRTANNALLNALGTDLNSRKEAAMTKAIRVAGKPNKDFLAKPRAANKKVAQMTIDNVKDAPNLPRTDDMGIILNNFVKYYEELYAHKKVSMPALNRLVRNLTLDLSPEERDSLNEEITEKEMVAAIMTTPPNKSPGTDRLPYECFRAAPELAAKAITLVGNTVTDGETQPKSWGEILVTVLPKEPDSYSTHKFRPISLLNTDYKMVMRIWANRLGPILANKIGHHQRGFIPGRDGRENIINVQLVIDLINARNEEGAIVFLDQEKAFDMVSFNTINHIFTSLDWPDRFRSLLKTVYRKNNITALVKANGMKSDAPFRVNSGTRQGCPLSPLIYAVVADLYNMAIIRHPQFKGLETTKGMFTKISAYADDTAVHLGAHNDIKIYKCLLRQYALATGGITNFNKSEAVPLGKWKLNTPNLGVRTVKACKYLGIITGDDPKLVEKTRLEREAKVYRQMDYWDSKLPSSPIDRVMVAKIMCLSIIWYHAGLTPGWDITLANIEKRVQSFIWKDSIPKVAKATLLLPKKEGGLSVWALKPKTDAFISMWIVKLLTGKLNPILTSTIQAITECYALKASTQVPIWESRIDHSQNIIKTTGSKLLALLQQAWAKVIRRRPALTEGDWVAYSNDELPKKKFCDQIYDGKARIVQPQEEHSKQATADWYERNPESGLHTYQAPEEGECWHLWDYKCYKLKRPVKMAGPIELAPTTPGDLYIVLGTNPLTGLKTKLPIEDILASEEELAPTEKYGPEFIKRNENSKLYKAQLIRNNKTYIKENKWITKYGIDLQLARKVNLGSFVHAKIKGFLWLFISHALPVGTRLRGKGKDTPCPHCQGSEDIKHMAFGCKTAQKIRRLAFTEWWGRTGDSTWANPHSFSQIFFKLEDNTALGKALATLNGIVTHHIWKLRCDKTYGREGNTPLPVIVNNIWTEFECSLQARIKYIENKANWWKSRSEAKLVPQDMAAQIIGEIHAECTTLTAILPSWAHSKTYALEAKAIREGWTNLDNTSQGEGYISLVTLPLLYPSKDWKWRLTTAPKPEGKGPLETDSDSEAGEESFESLSSASGD